MDRAFLKHDAPFETWQVLLVAALMWMVLILPLAFDTANSAIRRLGLFLVALLAGAFTSLMAVGILMLIVGTCGGVLSPASWSTVLTIGGLIGLGAVVCTFHVVRRQLGPRGISLGNARHACTGALLSS